MRKMICFDMDGTIADFYNVPGWLEMLKAENPTPYIVAEPMVDMEDLRDVLIALAYQGWEIRVISWLAGGSSETYKQAVRQAKLDWLNRYDFPCEVAHLVAYGTTKANCVRKHADYAILVDDNAKVRNGWHLGDTIDPTTENILESLRKLLDNPPEV